MLVAGSAVDRIPGPKYCAKLGFAELGPRAPLPRAPTLRRARHDLPPDFVLSLRAPRSTLVSARGPLRFDDELERAWEWLLKTRDALAAKFVVLPTPPDLTPGQRDRDLLAALSERLPREPGRFWVWEPSGPWEPDEAERLATALGFVLSFDPLLDQVPQGAITYARLRALGARKSFSDAALEDVSVRLGAALAGECFVVIDAPRAFEHAVRLRQLSSPGGEAPRIGSAPPAHDAR
jgi:uncharacterized protein YecE (DUF72 family)